MLHHTRMAVAAPAAVLTAALVSLAPGTAHASSPAGAALTLQALGLSVVENDGLIAASGPAAAVRTAAGLFAITGDVAAYTGDRETGTGYIVLSGDPSTEYVIMILPEGVTISSVQNDTTDVTAIYDNTTGKLDVAEPAETSTDIPPVDAETSTGPYGGILQAPVEVPVNVCGNTINVVGALNPAAGNLCVNE